MKIAYARQSAPSAYKLAQMDDRIELVRSSDELTDVNWGRRVANSELNPDVNNSVNKLVMRQLFKEHGVPTPKLHTLEEAGQVVPDSYGYETLFIGRPSMHTRGRGFWPIANRHDLIRAAQGTRYKRAATHFIEYIDPSRAPREYRVHIFRDRCIRLSEKKPDSNSPIGYTTIAPTHSVSHVREAAKQAMKAVGLDFGAVDIMASETECWVLEVNSAPGLGGTMPEVYARAFNRWKEGEI